MKRVYYKRGIPYIIEDVDDLEDIIDENLFWIIKQFISDIEESAVSERITELEEEKLYLMRENMDLETDINDKDVKIERLEKEIESWKLK